MAEVQTMGVDELIEKIKDGDEHGWQTEFNWLRKNHAERMRLLIASVLATGIQTPVLIGPDGRMWDGHHRVFAAWVLGLEQIPVEFAEGESHV